jgi:hypothetical protein
MEGLLHYGAINPNIIIYLIIAIVIIALIVYILKGNKYAGLRPDIASKMEKLDKQMHKSPFKTGTVVILSDGKVGVVRSVEAKMLGAGSGLPKIIAQVTVEIPGSGKPMIKTFAPEDLKIYEIPKG